jgi:hypothetical protein
MIGRYRGIDLDIPQIPPLFLHQPAGAACDPVKVPAPVADGAPVPDPFGQKGA